MKRWALVLSLVTVLFAPVAEAFHDPHARAREAYARLPLHFEANRGQHEEPVKFLARGLSYGLFLTQTEAVLVLDRQSVLRLRLVGANPEPAVSGVEPLPGRANYFIGNDPGKWRTNVPTYGKVEYRNVYPGIDLVYYGNQRRLEYDFIVAAGADPGVIAMRVDGADGLGLTADGHLVMKTRGRDVRLDKPYVYQLVDGRKQAVAGAYVVAEDSPVVRFEVASYDRSKPLVIDPVLIYSTLVGGDGDDIGSGVAVDAFGNAYVAGPTTSDMFPQGSATTFLHGPGGGNDIFVAKLDPTGSALLYATYFGGTGDEGNFASFAPRLAVDLAGQAYVTGQTNSSNFPGPGGGSATKIGPGGGVADAFVVKLSADGSALLYSVLLGSAGEERPFGIAVDVAGNAYVTGQVRDIPTLSGAFPTTDNAYDTMCGTNGVCDGSPDTFVAKLAFNGAVVSLSYATYLGGLAQESNVNGQGIVVDTTGHAYLTGRTDSDDFPVTPSAYDTVNHGGGDIYVTKLNTNPATCTMAPGINCVESLVYSTLIGGTALDGKGPNVNVAVDLAGRIYVAGETESADFRKKNELPGTNCPGPFVAVFDPSQSGEASLVSSTCEAGKGRSIAVDSRGTMAFLDTTKLDLVANALVPYPAGFKGLVTLDASCNAYATGSSADAPPIIGGLTPFQSALNGTLDAYVQKIGPGGPLAYIANTGADSVTVIDTANNAIVDTIVVQDAPVGVAVGPNGTHVWVTNSGSGSVSVIDMTTTPPGVSHIALGHVEPIAVVVAKSPSNRVTAYVADRHGPYTGTFDRGRIAMIDADPASPTFKQPRPGSPLLPAQIGQHPTGLAVSPDGARVYVSSLGDFAVPGAALAVIDTDTDQVMGGLIQPIGLSLALGMMPTADGSHLFIAGQDSLDPATAGAVAVLRTSDFALAPLAPGTPNPLNVGPQAVGVTVRPDGGRAYVSQPEINRVLVFDANPGSATFGKYLTTIRVAPGPFGIAAHPDGRRVYVANSEANAVSVLDVETALTPVFDVVAQVISLPAGTMPASFGPQFIAPAENLDVDADGIADAVDGFMDPSGQFESQSGAASTGFTNRHLCGNVSGEIIATGGLAVAVTNPAGLVIKTTGTSGQAEVRLCDFTTKLFPGGAVAPLQCGSLTARAVTGPIEVVLGASGVATVPSDVTFHVAEVAAGRFEVRHLGGTASIQVAFNGLTTSVAPGVVATFPLTTSRMDGTGQVDEGRQRHTFDFHVERRADGRPSGRLEHRVAAHRFVATAVNSLTFSDATAVFSGTGRWNGVAGYAFTARATDAGEPGAGLDLYTITITDSRGGIVATASGRLSGGNIEAH